MMKLSFGVMVLTAMIVAAPVSASTFGTNISPLKATSSTPDRSGDFNGDGRTDRVVMMPEAGSDRVAVEVGFEGANELHSVINLGAAAFAPGSGLDFSVVPAGRFISPCGYEVGCRDLVIETRGDSLMLSLDDGTGLLLHWTGEAFAQDFVRAEADPYRRLAGR